MRTTKNLESILELKPSDGCIYVKVHFNRRDYQFYSNKMLPWYRIQRRHVVNDRVTLYGYSYCQALLTYYNEFVKRRASNDIYVL